MSRQEALCRVELCMKPMLSLCWVWNVSGWLEKNLAEKAWAAGAGRGACPSLAVAGRTEVWPLWLPDCPSLLCLSLFQLFLVFPVPEGRGALSGGSLR